MNPEKFDSESTMASINVGALLMSNIKKSISDTINTMTPAPSRRKPNVLMSAMNPPFLRILRVITELKFLCVNGCLLRKARDSQNPDLKNHFMEL